jgi:PAS domain S-box-containing protein
MAETADGRYTSYMSGAKLRSPRARFSFRAVLVACLGALPSLAAAVALRRDVPISVALVALAALAGAGLYRHTARLAHVAEELGETQHRYRTLVDQLPVGVYLDEPGPAATNIYSNPYIIEMLGYPLERWVGDPGFFAEILHPDDRERVLESFTRNGSGADSFRDEYRLVAADGRTVWVWDESRLVRDERGRPLYMQGVLIDVTESREAQVRERAAETRYRRLVETLPLVTYVEDARTGRTLFVSPQLEELLGYPSERWLEEDGFFLTILHPDDRAELEHARQRPLPERSTRTFRLVDSNGDVRTLQSERVLVRDDDGEPLHVQGFWLDITEQAAFEKALRESEARFRGLYESSPHGVDIVDGEGYVLQANDALARMLGWDASELIGRRFADFTHPEDAAEDLALFEELLAGERDSYRIEKRYLRPDGSVVWVDLTAFGVRDGEGRVEFAIGLVVDITGRKELEQQLVQAQKMEAVGRLAGGIAHDFNNLLTAIRGYTTLAAQRVARLDAAAHAHLREVETATERAAALTEQLLAFSRQQRLELRSVDLRATIDEMGGLLRRLIGEDIAIRVDLAPDLDAVRADPHQLGQVLMNLAVNARDAMPDGGTLTIRGRNLASSARSVLLEISDTGHGIEPFFTTKGVGEGTGLGLSTVYGIVEQTGGSISVESEVGHGATFSICLPTADREPASPVDDLPAAPSAPAAHAHVLLVEDEPQIRGLVFDALRDEGYDVTAAATPAEALEHAAHGAFDLLLSDVVMPAMNGPELAEQIEAACPGIARIFMSGYAHDKLPPEMRDVPFLRKPFQLAELTATVRTVLTAARAARGLEAAA